MQFTLSLVCTFSFTGGFPFLAIALTIPIGILLLMGIAACVCCICVCKSKQGIHRKDFFSKKDCDNCFKCTHDEIASCCRGLGGLLLWILLFPISLPYCVIAFFWNGVCDAAENDGLHCNPAPCIFDEKCG